MTLLTYTLLIIMKTVHGGLSVSMIGGFQDEAACNAGAAVAMRGMSQVSTLETGLACIPVLRNRGLPEHN